MLYKPYMLNNYHKISKLKSLPKSVSSDISIVGRVLPFKTNNYVINELIDWENYENDPLFIINFPQRALLGPEIFDRLSALIISGADEFKIKEAVNMIRQGLNPHPAGQLECNTPIMNGMRINGIQHKYKETMLLFPTQGQTCHSYCSFCFRWPQFTGMPGYKMALNGPEAAVEYLKLHPEVTDVLFTGGDPMVMNANRLETYINALLKSGCRHLKTIRIGTKSLSFWPYRYLTDKDSKKILELFRRITDSGIHLSLMAHINHYREMSTPAFKAAVRKIQQTGALIRSQSPILNQVNDAPETWEKMWKDQVNLGIIPYYMFVPRNTGSHRFYSISLVRAYDIFQKAYSNVGGLARTVRGPSMSAFYGKIRIDGIPMINGEKHINMSFIQARNPDWVKRPFFAEYDETATWMNELKPSFGESSFFFEQTEPLQTEYSTAS